MRLPKVETGIPIPPRNPRRRGAAKSEWRYFFDKHLPVGGSFTFPRIDLFSIFSCDYGLVTRFLGNTKTGKPMYRIWRTK